MLSGTLSQAPSCRQTSHPFGDDVSIVSHLRHTHQPAGEAMGAGGYGELGCEPRYNNKTVKTPDSNDAVPVIKRKKELREYSPEQRALWKLQHDYAVEEKTQNAKRWLFADWARRVEETPDEKVNIPAVIVCGQPLFSKERPTENRAATVYFDTEGESIYYDRLNCHSVWACPRCSTRDMYRRSLELADALTESARQGLKMLFITFTLPHNTVETTREVLNNLVVAYRDFGNQGTTKSLKKQFGYIGNVKSTDFTYTPVSSGRTTIFNAHAHYHTVWFFDTETPVQELAELIREKFTVTWDFCQRKQTGRALNREKGIDFQVIDIPSSGDGQASKIAEYTAKVISLYVGKTDGKKSSITPFDLLTPPEGMEDDYRRAFLDYYHGTKGVRRMVYTPHLRGLLLSGKVDDERKSVIAGEMSSLLVYIFSQNYEKKCEFEQAFSNYDYERANEIANEVVSSFIPRTKTDFAELRHNIAPDRLHPERHLLLRVEFASASELRGAELYDYVTEREQKAAIRRYIMNNIDDIGEFEDECGPLSGAFVSGLVDELYLVMS